MVLLLQPLVFDDDAPLLRFSPHAPSVSVAPMTTTKPPARGRGAAGPRRRRRKPEIYNLPTDREPKPGELVRHHRTVAGLWQEDLAEALDVTPQTISRYELGRDLSTEKLRRIAVALGKPLSAFLPGVDDEPADPGAAELLAHYAEMGERDREALLHMARRLSRPTLHDRDEASFSTEPDRRERRG